MLKFLNIETSLVDSPIGTVAKQWTCLFAYGIEVQIEMCIQIEIFCHLKTTCIFWTVTIFLV